MRERPILFSSPMVRALLAGTKTQTRRVVKPQPVADTRFSGGHYIASKKTEGAMFSVEAPYIGMACPYGQPGDRLWVREAFDFLPAGGPDQPQACEIVYWSTGSLEPRTAPTHYNPTIYGRERVRPSIHMPRWASRLTLEVTGVRVERLQDISEADCRAEGITDGGCTTCGMPEPCGCAAPAPDAREAYATLWQQINGADSWAANPWVWVVEFRKVAP